MTERFTIGVDYGTLSGRAVVVRVSDGAELGSAVTPYPDGVIERALPATGAALAPTGRCRSPTTTCEVLRTPVPAALEAAGVDPAAVDRHRHRLHRLHHAAGHRRRHAALRAARARATDPHA